MNMSRIVIKSHEGKVTRQNFTTKVDITAFVGENVADASRKQKAIIWSLDKKDLPSNSLDRILSGFANASQPDFKALCTSQKALLSTPFFSFTNKGVDAEQLIHSTLTCLKAKYFELSSADEWNGSDEVTNSAFLGAAGPPSN